MAINLITKRIGNKNCYLRVDTDEKGNTILYRKSGFEVIQSLYHGHSIFSLIDEEGNTDALFHKYINEYMFEAKRSVNSRRKYSEVICKLYAFISLMGYSLFALDYDELYQFRAFLQGTGGAQCSNETVNIYLGIIRDYFRTMRIPWDVLFAQHLVTRESLDSDFGSSNIIYVYDANLSVNAHKQDRVPKYISMEQYIQLVEIARSKGDWAGIILMHLMFRYGMRLGECLGLTEEDLVSYRIKGIDVPTLIVRNRVTDRPWQHAKSKIIPRNKRDYEADEYIKQWDKDDYAHYYLTESGDFAEALAKFICETRAQAEQNHSDNYHECEADIVYPVDFKKKGLEKNHYIFVNRQGKRLSAQFWGSTLKRYFIEAGIPIDSGKKDNNLSHRFRHGFAMMHARFMDPPVPPQELQKMLHHKQLSTTMIYYNPTIEDEYDYKTKMQNRFFDTNPRLNEIIKDFLEDTQNDNGEDNDETATVE